VMAKIDEAEKVALLDSLSAHQRKQIAILIRSAVVEGDYQWDGEESRWCEDTKQTLANLAATFESHDPHSVLN
jgi:hypothetical protein